MMFQLSLRNVAAAGFACLLGFASTAPVTHAAYTTIKAPDPFNETPEDGHRTIFGNIYGGTFQRVGPDNVDMSNGSITASRIDDSLATNGILGLVDGQPGGASDQVWHDGFTDASAKVRYARDSQTFGFWEGTSGGTFTPLFDIQGQGYAVSGSLELADMRGKTWRWGRSRGRGGFHSSLPGENPDGLDHMVTYKIEGLANTDGYTTWLLFWEDLNFNPAPNTLTSDRDIQDLVIEVRAIATAVPEPTTGALLLGGLGAMHLATRRTRRA